MLFNKHSELAGQHAFLSASQYHWINYDEDKIERTYTQKQMAKRGTDLHAFAHEAVRLGVRMPKTQKTINLYVNDAIGFRMSCEVTLFYSINAFGTADAISYSKGKLRVHDLKTGVTPCSVHQLEVYAALFCLEYRFKPHEIEMEFRIYQSNEVQVFEGDPDVIAHIMDRFVVFDKIINARRLEDMS